MLQSVSVRTGDARRHSSHYGGGIHLSTRAGHRHMGHLRRHSWLAARLTLSMSHAGCAHGMTRMNNAGVLLHSWMKATRSNTSCHHFYKCRLSTAWISTPNLYRYFIRFCSPVSSVRGTGRDIDARSIERPLRKKLLLTTPSRRVFFSLLLFHSPIFSLLL